MNFIGCLLRSPKQNDTSRRFGKVQTIIIFA